MPRKVYVAKREVLPDPMYNSKIVTKEELHMIPYGNKLYKMLEKLGIYRKETT